MLPCPPERLAPSLCFAVTQTDKIRRCEDYNYRRSHHNDTVECFDVPSHHNIPTHLEVAHQSHSQGNGICDTWCQDLAAAYRQFPVRNPAHGYTVLLTPAGPTLWRHNSLCFGATGSVWSFNRAADAMGFLARQLLATPVCHFVDDFSCTEPAVTSQSSYP